MARILVVDDEPMNGTLAMAALKGHDVEIAEDSQTAQRMLAKNQYDLILMDGNLPKPPDGVGLVREVRSGGVNRQTPIVAFSNQPSMNAKMVEAGANDIYPKENGIKDLAKVVNSVLAGQQTEPLRRMLPDLNLSPNSPLFSG